MESLTDPAPLDPALATATHQAEERERVAFVMFMLLAIVVLLGFLGWRVLFGGPDWKPAAETWMEIEGAAVPMPDPWAVEEPIRTREESGARITEAAFLFEEDVLLDSLAARWEEFLEARGYDAQTVPDGFGETRRVRVTAEKQGESVELDLRTWDRSGRLSLRRIGD